MIEPSLPEKVVSIETAFSDARIAHAFGGALALAYYAEPRATIDIDVNVFLAPDEHARVDSALVGLGAEGPAETEPLMRDGWFRYRWGRTPLDVFFAEYAFHTAMERRRRSVPFGEGEEITILAPEHLVTCKAIFDRPKDWLDIEQIAIATAELDLDETFRWLADFVEADDPRHARLRDLLG